MRRVSFPGPGSTQQIDGRGLRCIVRGRKEAWSAGGVL